jgi:RNA recognition motif-containing protein
VNLISVLQLLMTATFQKHFGAYGEIVDSVIMKNKHTSQPRGFGFITYADPAVVDTVMEDNHVINGKQVSSVPSSLFVLHNCQALYALACI